MNLTNFEEYIDDIILGRGKDYFLKGKVGEVREVEPGQHTAVVYGSDEYQVTVMVNQNRRPPGPLPAGTLRRATTAGRRRSCPRSGPGHHFRRRTKRQPRHCRPPRLTSTPASRGRRRRPHRRHGHSRCGRGLLRRLHPRHPRRPPGCNPRPPGPRRHRRCSRGPQPVAMTCAGGR